MSHPTITLVAAMGKNRVIGIDGRMPWHLPADLKRFKQITMGKPVIMGRKTFESIGKPLPGRTNIVLTRGDAPLPDGVIRAGSLDAALAEAGDVPEVMIIGGAQIYAEALSRATAMELTFVDAAPEGDTYFPEWERSEWDVVATKAHPADDRNAHRLVICRLVRQG